MSDFSSNSTINLTVNGQGVEDKISKYSKQLVDLRKKAQQAAEIGDKGTLKKTQKEIIKVENQLRKVQTATANVEQTMQNLDKATPKNLRKDLQTLKSQLNGIERGSEAWKAHIEKIKTLQKELKKINDEMKLSESWWERLNNKLNDWQTTIAAAAAAMTGLIMAGRSAVKAYADMDAELANVRKFTGMTASEVEDLNEEFKKMDTRTSREELNRLAQEAGRLGKQAKEDVLGFVKAADVINVALDDLGDGATLTLSKLTNIFGDEKIYGTEQSLLKVGSVINELSQNSTASASYLAQFAQRLAGVGAQAKMTIPELMSYAAVLDSQGQAVEMSATALSKLIMDMFKDSAKIAKATGMNLDEFNAALQRSTNEGLMMLLDRLHELGDMNVLAPVFADMGEDGARASAVIASLAGKIDMVKWEQEEATKAFEEGISVTNEFNVQNTTVQAGLDKAKKSVEEMAVELGKELMPIMSHVISSTSMIMKLMMSTITFIKENAVVLGTLVAQFIAFRIAVNASNIAFKAHYAWIVLSNAATKAYNMTLAATKAAVLLCQMAVAKLNGNYAKQQLLVLSLRKQSAMLASGYGLLAVAIIGVAGALYQWYQKEKQAREEARKFDKIKEEAIVRAQEEIDKLHTLRDAANDENLAMEERRKAVEKLNKIIPGYNAQIDETTGKLKESKKALDDYIASLIHQQEIEGAKDMLKELSKQKARQVIEFTKAQDTLNNTYNPFDNSKYTGSNGKKLGLLSGSASSGATTEEIQNYNSAKSDFDKAKNALDSTNNQIKKLTDIYGKDLRDAEVNSGDDETNITNTSNNNVGSTDDKSKADKFAKEKAWKEKELALNRIARATGQKDEEDFQRRILEINEEFNAKILERTDLTEQERLEAQASMYEASAQISEKGQQAQIDAINEYYADLKRIEDQRFIDNKISQEQYNNALSLLELKHLKEIVNYYKEGTKERNEAQAKYDDALMKDMMNKRKKMEDIEKEHQKKMDEIRNKVFSDTPQKNKENYDAEMAALTEVYNQEVAAAQGNKQELLALEEAFQKQKMLIAEKYDQITRENGFTSMQEANAKLLKWMESDQGQAVLQTYDLVMDGMSSIFSACSDMVQSELEIETAAIEKRYEKEISQAEGNQYKVKKLEEKKQKEEAAAKNKANKKMFAMQVMQAIAETAMGALNAYASTLAIPIVGPILAPAAAATAIATGMLQVAAIKKQQQASEAQGYSEGGYTPAGGKNEPKGIVHAGEWVASQKLLANPQAAAIIQSLDYAQRTNTIGSISSAMVSNSNTAVASLARLTDSGSANDNSLNETIARLTSRLNEPFVTVNTVTGDYGIKEAQDEYEQYIKNKTPKSRRK